MFEKRTLLFSVLMAGIMSILIGSGITLIKTGIAGFGSAFAQTAPIAFGVALPTSIFVTPLVERLVDRLLGPPAQSPKESLQ